MEPSIALVFSPEPWVEMLHRSFADHGGARVRQIVVDPFAALDEEYDVLVVSHRWPALTPALVRGLHERGRRILGVFDPDDIASRGHLLALEVDMTIAHDASPGEFVAELSELAPIPSHGGATITSPLQHGAGSRTRGLVVVGGAGGSGRSELALGLADALARTDAVLLLDADTRAPSLATRLAIPFEPNLVTLVEEMERGSAVVATVRASSHGRVRVVAGLPSPAVAEQVPPAALVGVTRELAAHGVRVVADVSAADRDEHARALLADAEAVVAVCHAAPVSVSRLLTWLADTPTLLASGTHVVVNRAMPDRHRRVEIAEEIERTFLPASLSFVPVDSRVERAGWDGTLVPRGPFTRAMLGVATRIGPTAADPRSSRAFRRATRDRRVHGAAA